MAKAQSAAEKEAEHAIEQAIANEGNEDQSGHFDRDINTHERSPPESGREPVDPEAGDDGEDAKPEFRGVRMVDPGP